MDGRRICGVGRFATPRMTIGGSSLGGRNQENETAGSEAIRGPLLFFIEMDPGYGAFLISIAPFRDGLEIGYLTY